ncbi:hypothetical protein J6O48_06510 [bacterium]|nr:hypothetical protein [bacterium]
MNFFGIRFGESAYEKYKHTPKEKQNHAHKFEDWTIQVDKGQKDAAPQFRINREGNTDVNKYNKILNQLSKDYIAMMDENDDGKVSYDEFEKFHKDEFKDNLGDIPEGSLEYLKNLFTILNLDNENDSKDNLDVREIMNMFHTMDGTDAEFLNDTTYTKKMNIDGLISQNEYETFTEILSKFEDNDQSFNLFRGLKLNFEYIFKNYKE